MAVRISRAHVKLYLFNALTGCNDFPKRQMQTLNGVNLQWFLWRHLHFAEVCISHLSLKTLFVFGTTNRMRWIFQITRCSLFNQIDKSLNENGVILQRIFASCISHIQTEELHVQATHSGSKLSPPRSNGVLNFIKSWIPTKNVNHWLPKSHVEVINSWHKFLYISETWCVY